MDKFAIFMYASACNFEKETNVCGCKLSRYLFSKSLIYLMMKALFVVMGLIGGDQDGLVGRVALELLPTEALLLSRVEVEANDLILEQ